MTIPIKIISKKEFLKQNKKPNQEQVWNSIAKTWNKYVVKKIPIVVDFLKNKKGKIIDLGCGDGRNMIPNPNITYYGIDFSEQSLNHAKKRAKKEKINIKLFKKQSDNLSEFKTNMFDHGLFIAALHCIETKKNRSKTLKEFYRILKPNAEALITVWNSEDKRFSHIKGGREGKDGQKGKDYNGDIYMSWKQNNIPHMRYYYLYKKQELLNLLKSTGFKILEFYEPLPSLGRVGGQVINDRFSKKNWIIRVGK